MDRNLCNVPSQKLFNELARRYRERTWLGSDFKGVNSLLDAGLHLRFEPEEHVKVIYLAVNGQHIEDETWTLSEPGQVGLRIRHIVKQAILKGASQLALIHNHPCGTPEPSDADILGTCRLIEATRHLNIVLLDHLIVAQSGYFSMEEAGILPQIKSVVKEYEVCSKAVVERSYDKDEDIPEIFKKPGE